jgi:site-specific recombinase XerD
MNKKTKDIKLLVVQCVNCMRELGYAENCIENHRRRWVDGIVRYMTQQGFIEYSADIGERYLEKAVREVAPSTQRARKRSIHLLSDFLENNTVRRRIVHLVDYPLPGEIGKIATEYLTNMKKLRRSEATILNHRRMLSYFIAGLALNNIHHVREIREKDILAFVDSSPCSKEHRYYTIKLFSRFLYENAHTDVNFSYLLEHKNFPCHEKLPSVYNPDEVRQIEHSVEQSSNVGKRDYAILLLASRLGLRVSDIAALRFNNLDWDNNRIVLIQSKTGNPIELPLLTDVGESIVNYLRYARPKSDHENIFLTACAPFRPMTRISLNGVITRIMQESGVDISKRKFGPHSMRHSLASNLLKNGTSISTISSVLGHESTASTMEYLRIDTTSLSRCALDVPAVANGFYEQKGGLFYD